MSDGHPSQVSQETVRGRELPDAGARGRSLFLVNDGGLRVVPLPAAGAVVVGRGDDVDVRVADHRMSRRHMCLYLGDTLVVEDLRSANGTTVGGHRLAPGQRRALAVGDAIGAGDTTMLVREPHPAPAGRPAERQAVMSSASEAMAPVLALADRAAASTISVLLLGETGVGKDVLAERIHGASPRAAGPFVRLNCAAFSPGLLASELFGHEKGAFTGATCARPGLLQSASGGTVFLDEVGDLPAEHQAKLLLVLERREVLPVGAVRPRPIDVRFVCATNRALPREVEAGQFRSDLYFRLNGITIEIPPLRARVPEIEGLAQRFAREAAQAIGVPDRPLSRDALATLQSHHWPGNIRELRSVIERAVLVAAGATLERRDLVLPATCAPPASPEPPPRDATVRTGRGAGTGTGTECDQIVEALATCGGNQSRAAKLLGMSRNRLIARIAKYGLARPLRQRTPP